MRCSQGRVIAQSAVPNQDMVIDLRREAPVSHDIHKPAAYARRQDRVDYGLYPLQMPPDIREKKTVSNHPCYKPDSVLR